MTTADQLLTPAMRRHVLVVGRTTLRTPRGLAALKRRHRIGLIVGVRKAER